MSYLRPSLLGVPGYTPGEQPPPGSAVIKLNTNENPYPPSPQVFEALHTLEGEWLRRYPDARATPLRQIISQIFDVPLDWITVGNGSDELLSVIFRAFVDPADTVAYPMPSYVLYRTLTQLQGAQSVEVAFPEDFTFPLAALRSAQGKVTLVAAPNSPSGTAIPVEALGQLAAEVPGILVIDEAYVDFAEEPALPLVQQYSNVIVLRTLSKGYSLAGLRLGFAIAHPDIIRDLNTVKDSYAVDAIAALVGAAALSDQAHMQQNVAKVRRSRQHLTQQLQQLGCRVWPSQANFLLVQPPLPTPPVWQQHLKEGGILVRYFDLPGVSDKLRITVGTEDQNAQLIAQMHHILKSAA